MKETIKKLQNTLSPSQILLNESMAKHTSFKCGGACDIMIKPKNIEEIQSSIKILKENNIPYIVLGRGSNILVSDKGIQGAVIKLSDDFASISIEKSSTDKKIVKAQSGIKLKNLAEFCRDNELGGAEFLHGIPGSLGGAITMNAGAYSGEIKNIVKSVTVLDENLNILEIDKDNMNFGYRTSIIQNTENIVLEVSFELMKKEKAEIQNEMTDYMNRRREKQPLNYASAGSTFKRPEGYFAGKLIQDCNLKGLKYKGAMVSEKHAGFIVNTGNASSTEILELIEFVEKTVFDVHGVKLEREVRIL